MRAKLCCETLKNASLRYPEIRGTIVHSDRGSQYTSAAYRAVVQKYGIVQSMNRAGGRCHDNARCESIWTRMKEELFYHRDRKTEHYKIEELKFMVWRYFMSYWSNRRICSSIGGLPRFIILVGNVSSVIDNFIHCDEPNTGFEPRLISAYFFAHWSGWRLRNLSSFFNSQSAEMEHSGMEAD